MSGPDLGGMIDRLSDALTRAHTAGACPTGAELYAAILGAHLRSDLFLVVTAILAEQDYGSGGQPSRTGMAWALVNGLLGQGNFPTCAEVER